MSNRSALALVLGTVSALALSYCIYFDQKRRSDPEYKKKVHNRRVEHDLKVELENDENLVSLKDFSGEVDMQETLSNAFNLIQHGKVTEGLNQLATAQIMCAQPGPIFEGLENSQPEEVLACLMLGLQQLEEEEEEDMDQQSSTTSTSNSLHKTASIADIS